MESSFGETICWTPSRPPADFQGTPSGNQGNARGLPGDCQGTASGLPVDSQGTPSGQWELNLESLFGELFLESPFKEPILRTALEVDGFHNSDSQLKPNKLTTRLQKDFNQVLIYILHLEILIGYLMWRALLEGPWIYLILPVKTQNSTQFSGFFLSKSKFDLKKYDK